MRFGGSCDSEQNTENINLNTHASQLTRANIGAVVARYNYDAYGNTNKQLGITTSDALDQDQVNQPYRYQSHYLDKTTGLYDFGYRFYSPGLGRFLNQDPIGEAGGLNLYGFVGGNPTNALDPYGLCPDSVDFQKALLLDEIGLKTDSSFNPSAHSQNLAIARNATAHSLRALLRLKAGFAPRGRAIIVDSSADLRENFADVLRGLGYNARSVKEIFTDDPGDAFIRSLARNLGALVITKDRGDKDKQGFGRLAVNLPGRVRIQDEALRLILPKLK